MQLAKHVAGFRIGYFPSHRYRGSRFCISLLAFASLARVMAASQQVSWPVDWIGHVLKQDVVNMHVQAPQSWIVFQHLSY